MDGLRGVRMITQVREVESSVQTLVSVDLRV